MARFAGARMAVRSAPQGVRRPFTVGCRVDEFTERPKRRSDRWLNIAPTTTRDRAILRPPRRRYQARPVPPGRPSAGATTRTSAPVAIVAAMRARQGFSGRQVETAWKRQQRTCPCCQRSLAHMDWDAHHRDGDRSNNRTTNLVLVCAACHHNCFHDQRGVSRRPIKCRILRPPAFTVTGRLCGCRGCGQCTSRYKVCTTEIRKPYARTCSYCAVG
jgi:hypothetical protein